MPLPTTMTSHFLDASIRSADMPHRSTPPKSHRKVTGMKTSTFSSQFSRYLRKAASGARRRGASPRFDLCPQLYIGAKLHKLAAEDPRCRTQSLHQQVRFRFEMSGFGDEYALHLMSAVADELRTVKRHDILVPVQLL